MPRSRNIQAYPQHLHRLARAMLDGKIPKEGVRFGGFTINRAKHFRQEWYAFVRAHYPSIELAAARRKAAFASKDEHGLNIWSSRHRAWETQLETILLFEVYLEIIDADSATLLFRSKTQRGTNVNAVLDQLNASHESIEMMQLTLDSSVDSKRITHHIPGTKDVDLRSDPVLQHFFTMPDEERLRHGSMRYDEIRAFRLRYTDEAWSAYIGTITDPEIHEQIKAALTEGYARDLDTPTGNA